jgi:uncharacterized protein (DUF433 family)
MATELKTEHPHIVKVPGVAGGEPVIAGTRVGVAFIARLVQAGEEPSEIVAAYPSLAPAAVYDAVSYYLDHREEIDELIADSSLTTLAERYGFSVSDNGKITFAGP